MFLTANHDFVAWKITADFVHFKPGGRETVIILTAISCYNMVELTVLLSTTFRSWKGLYFWSLLVTGGLGVVPYSLGSCLGVFLHIGPSFLAAMSVPAGIVMVAGQSIVLYSRLHLVVSNKLVLRAVVYSIIIAVFLLQIPTAVLLWGWYLSGKIVFLDGHYIMGKISTTLIVLQETVISAIYIWETTKILRLIAFKAHKRILYELVAINVAIFIMDAISISFEFANCFATQTIVKGLFYSIKLKVEIGVLRKLVDVARDRRQPTEIVEQGLRLCSREPVNHPTVSTVSSSWTAEVDDTRRRGSL
ncbi:hypothetical protein FE257_004682 [Aspergillus nanangensis]|uniref:DUF7703 domain-containing protein n=1 Tax=Aspergillus nanangensis TaxID=2582783 RepID=A0AAD4CYG9_ASPNN|nr:hypothetical protein FE257_004682 [Aspergillus nanangensis]